MLGTTSIADIYMPILETLSADNKLELITKLSTSLRKENTKNLRPDIRACFKGDWSNINSEDLRKNDFYGRTTTEW